MDHVVWMDAALGLATILIVFGHTLGGVLARGWLDADGAFRQVYQYIYLFHVPLFFVVSGLYCIGTIRRGSVDAFVSLSGSIAWPYLIWGFFIGTALLPLVNLFTSSAPSNVRWVDRLRQALTGELSWFPWTLYLTQVVLIPLAQIPIWILFAASVVLCLYLQDSLVGTLNSVVDYFPFLLFGAMLQPVSDYLKVSHDWKLLLLSFGAFILIGVALMLDWTAHKPVWLLCGIIGSLASICLVQYLGEAIQQRLLASLGIATWAIFFLHPYFQGATREFVLRTLGTSPIWQLLIPTIIAVAGPFLVWKCTQLFAVPWLFQLRLPKYGG
jgi:fucose 4-O-acetylase-like acetyltransferase